MSVPRTPRQDGIRWLVAVAASWMAVASIPIGASDGQVDGPIDEPSVLVMPFEPVGAEPSLVWLPEAIAIRLSDELEARRVGAFTRAERLLAYEARGVPPTAQLSRPSALGLGRLLGASLVIVGGIELNADVLVLRFQRLRVDGASSSDELVEQGPIGELFEIVARVATRLMVGGDRASTSSQAPDLPLSAFEGYVKGLLAAAPGTRGEFLRAASRQAPDDHRIRFALWEAAMAAGEHEEALDVAWIVPDDAPEARRAALLASRALIALGRLDEAEEVLREMAPEAAVWAHRGLVQLGRGGRPDSGRLSYPFHQAVVADPDDPDRLFNLGYAYWLEEDLATAAYWLKESLRRNAGDAEARFLLGTVLERLGDGQRASVERTLAEMQRAEAVDGWQTRFAELPSPGDPGPLRLRTRPQTPRQRRVDTHLREGLRRERRRWSRAHLDRGRAASDASRDDEAVRELRRAIQLQPDQAEAHLVLAQTHLRADRASAAARAGAISAWLGETVEVRLLLAEAHARLGDLGAARREATRALALDPGAPAATALLDRLATDGVR